ncbi:MAG: Gfo/Idh/MocA family oxidoreductase [Ruminococcaceae bacterium]|nr:Gfo/Idh/MocA family oxidoreductase [Oscillospiraceae bacterium]
MKYAIIGTGWIAKAFADGVKIAEGISPFAIYSRTREKGEEFAQKTGAQKVFTSLEEMASDKEIDAVYIASPNAFHYSQSKLFLEHGKHVICEKPITVNPQEFEELFALANSKKLVYTEAIMMMHFPNRFLIENAIKRIGKIFSARVDFSQLSSKYPALLRGENPNIFNPEMATGCLMDLGIYNIYFALYFFGKPEKITSTSLKLDTGADALGTAVFHYSDKQITLTYSKVGQSRTGTEIYGDKGTIVVESISKLVNISLISNDGEVEKIAEDTEKEEVMSYEAKDFFRFIRDYDECFDEYKKCAEFSLEVSRIMEEIRKQNDMKYTSK